MTPWFRGSKLYFVEIQLKKVGWLTPWHNPTHIVCAMLFHTVQYSRAFPASSVNSRFSCFVLYAQVLKNLILPLSVE